MLRRVIKLDENGKEMVDENGQYVFEEIEVADAKSSEKDSTDSTEDDQVPDESTNSVDEVDEIIEETADSNPEPVEQKSWKERLNEFGLTEEQLWSIIQRFQANINAEQALEQVNALPEEKKQKIITSLGINLKNMKIN
ncbi:hypothetical protein mflW37_5800 [Mesoplasma florum W37]|uniref:Uncharacterized protein n=1 Tax=Mesoplasma florum TaxID=2151 RepID=A0AAD0HTP4_MESFO|nr:hypothetical protein [Mesoplasma florum]AGY41647.1 hypothetical protein mflW37_5800 [Mesoplasma florum W37]AVN59851.1 hypothetical protein CG008_03070 [Mesoplasma florum]AVN65985.1 hypothetical protein MflW12_5800 [Mesoplasma florum]